MQLTEQLVNKWGPVLDHPELPKIADPYKRAVTAMVLENQQIASSQQAAFMGGDRSFLSESAPTNATGSSISNYDPILISLVRRALPNLIAYDICGVQPMTGPTGLIFAMRSKYDSQTGTEALFNEANTKFSAANKLGANGASQNHQTSTPGIEDYTLANTGNGMSTAQGEALGDSGTNLFAEMAFSIEKVTVTARERALKAEYTLELAQDLKAIHGLDAETELANILSTEILAEINREVIRTVYSTAVLGCSAGTTTAGTFDLDTDSNGRWSVEKFKGLIFQIEREANLVICSSDVASAMAMAGVLQYTPALQADLQVDDTGNTFAGLLHNRIKVYIDPYYGSTTAGTNTSELVTVGYKGTSPYDAGLFYCPYVPLQMVRAIGQDTFQPRIGFKTRYGMVANPFAEGTTAGLGRLSNRSNVYYRIFKVSNLL
jgi:hypothetical protein